MDDLLFVIYVTFILEGAISSINVTTSILTLSLYVL